MFIIWAPTSFLDQAGAPAHRQVPRGPIYGPAWAIQLEKVGVAVGMQVFCDLGTDCTDCGAWDHVVPASQESSIPLPVQQLMSLGVEVYARSHNLKDVPEFR